MSAEAKGDYDNPESDAEPAPGARRSPMVLILIIVGVVLILLICGGGILATLLMPALLKAKSRAQETKCANNLKRVGMAAILYSDEQKAYPYVAGDKTGQAGLQLLFTTKHLDNAAVLECPFSDGANPDDASYEGFPIPRAENTRPSRPIAWDKNPHPNGSRCFVFVDGHVEIVRTAAEAEALLLRAKTP